MKVRQKLATLLLCAAILLPACSFAAESIPFNFQSSYLGSYVLNSLGLNPWLDSLAEQSRGKLRPRFIQSGGMFSPDEVVPSLVSGRLDAGVGVVTYQDRLFPYAQAFTLPSLARDSRQASELYWQAYQTLPEIREELDKIGKVLTIWGSARSGIFSAVGPVRSPADLNNRRVLVWNSGQAAQIRAWGAVPVMVTPDETYYALQKKQGDMFYGPLPTGIANNIMDVTHDLTLMPGSSIPLVLWVSHKFWDKLPPDLQEVLVADTGQAMSRRFGQMLYDSTNKDLDTMRDAGLKIRELSDEQYQAFRAAGAPVITEYWSTYLTRLGVKNPEAWIRTMYDLAAKCAAPQPRGR